MVSTIIMIMNRTVMKTVLILGLLICLWQCIERPVWSCPNCREAIAEQDPAVGSGTDVASQQQGSLARGIYLSILLMLGTLFLVGGGLFRMLLNTARESDSRMEQIMDHGTLSNHE